MKANNANQRVAREIAEITDSGYDARAREIRAENLRRTQAANKPRETRVSTSFMRSIMSTPYAEVRS